MGPERWRKVEWLFHEALERPAGQRSGWLVDACAGDAELQREVGALLAADQLASDFLERGAPGVPSESAVGPGTLLGRYRLVRKLGEGGVATVYLAVRADEYRKRVAVKVLKRGMDTDGVIRRFRRERQILAGLDHPNVASLLDGGSTSDGRPYFVLDYVEGLEITEYCRRRQLTLERRIALFRAVCAAVHHAHRNLVVHRDLKPSNILVAHDGEPKLLDFGIAKLLNPELCTTAGELTTDTVRPMTPRYASPEQVRGGPITTASDVYSLGVLLYRLLAGVPPYARESASPTDIAHAVCALEPERPSVACLRTEEGRPFRKRLRGDLDKVVLKAMAKEPERRYASAHALAEDLRRYLDGQPVAAHRPGFAYRVAKTVRRNRTAAAAAAVVAATMLAGVATTARQARMAEARRAEAEAQRQRAETVTGFVLDLFRLADPGERQGSRVTAREILERGARQILDTLDGRPEERATLLSTMGTVYRHLGLYRDAEPLLQDALALRREVLGQEHLEVARSLAELGVLRTLLGDHEGAEALHRRALEIRRTRLGPGHPEVAESLVQLAEALNSETSAERAESLLREALAVRRATYGEGHPAVAEVLANLATIRQAKGDLEEAERLCREALAIRRGHHVRDPDLLVSLQNLATILLDKGDAGGAEPLYREALEKARRELGPKHRNVALILYNLAQAELLQGEAGEAEDLHRESLALRREVLGLQSVEVPGGLHGLAAALEMQGRTDEAEDLHREALSLRRAILGPEHTAVAASLERLGTALRDRGRLPEAERLFAESLGLRRRRLPADHPFIARSLVGLGTVLLARGDAARAEDALREALRIVRARLPEGHWRIGEAEAALGLALEAGGQRAEAAALLRSGGESLGTRFGPHHPQARWVRARLARTS